MRVPSSSRCSISQESRVVARKEERGERTVRYRFVIPTGRHRVRNPSGCRERGGPGRTCRAGRSLRTLWLIRPSFAGLRAKRISAAPSPEHGKPERQGGKKCAPRPSESGQLEEKGQHHERGIDPGQEDQELILGQTALRSEVSGTECGDQDVEHERDGSATAMNNQPCTLEPRSPRTVRSCTKEATTRSRGPGWPAPRPGPGYSGRSGVAATSGVAWLPVAARRAA